MKLTERRIRNFWNKVEKTDECWNWKAALSTGGYGKMCFSDDGKSRVELANRISYVLHYGNVPELTRMYVCHKCDNRKCVRPSHLFLGTAHDNLQDCYNKRRRDASGEKNANAKLSRQSVLAIKDMLHTSYQNEVAKAFGVSQQLVSLISRNEIWV